MTLDPFGGTLPSAMDPAEIWLTGSEPPVGLMAPSGWRAGGGSVSLDTRPASSLELEHLAGSNRLLVGYDSHPASHRAVIVAADLAHALGASLMVLHVIDLEDYPIDPDAADYEVTAARTVAEERVHAESLLSEARVEWTYETARDDPAHALAKIAHDNDVLLIVVGASGRGLAQRLLHGSVPQALTRKQRKPVLVVPAPPKRQ
jgi:nucleotide-binding universal stress UspA family protein